jgi:hypothetical protein
MAALNNDLMKDGAGTQADFIELGFSVFNREDGAEPTFDAWRDQGRYSDIVRRLGYRLRLVSATWDASASAGSTAQLRLRIANDGYARVLNPRLLRVHLKPLGGGSERVLAPLSADLRGLLPGSGAERNLDLPLALPSDLPVGSYALHLRLPDPSASIAARSEYCIRLANQGLWDAASGAHDLGITLAVSAAGGGGGAPSASLQAADLGSGVGGAAVWMPNSGRSARLAAASGARAMVRMGVGSR